MRATRCGSIPRRGGRREKGHVSFGFGVLGDVVPVVGNLVGKEIIISTPKEQTENMPFRHLCMKTACSLTGREGGKE